MGTLSKVVVRRKCEIKEVEVTTPKVMAKVMLCYHRGDVEVTDISRREASWIILCYCQGNFKSEGWRASDEFLKCKKSRHGGDDLGAERIESLKCTGMRFR